ncbi:MAG: ATP-dependent zinc metalloprotease FtsH [Devosia sp.]|nr:ATP-dependent zinc metalloprotease FtsH [Devosia sp.]
MDRFDKRILWALIAGVAAVLAIAVIALVTVEASTGRTLSYSALLDDIGKNQVVRVQLQGSAVAGQRRDGTIFQSYAPDLPGLVSALRAANVDITASAPAEDPAWLQATFSTLPVLVLGGIMIFFMLRQSGAAKRAGGLGRSRAKLLDATTSPVRFEDVAGAVEAKRNLVEIVDFLRHPERYRALGGRIPKGVLMVGPPGSGKTLLARAVAGEAGVPFYAISGSDFVEMFVGIGASRVRDMFKAAKHTAPCIIFIDEIDAVGRHRGAGMGQGNDEREQTLNQLLVEMDGIGGSQGIIVIAATNRPDILDPALVRSGRFDREVVIDHPDRLARQQILEVHLRAVPIAPTLDLEALAQATPGLSGADLANLVNEAVLLAVRSERFEVGMEELERAKDKVLCGDERQRGLASPRERERAAYRAAGAALTAMRLPGAHPVEKASIIPRGRSAHGLTQLDPESGAPTRRELCTRLAILLAGRAAEQLVFGADAISAAVAPQLSEATELARMMVMRWAMSGDDPAMTYGHAGDDVFLGRSMGHPEETPCDEDARRISAAVRTLLADALAAATACLVADREALDTLARVLSDREMLSAAEIAAIVDDRIRPLRQPA